MRGQHNFAESLQRFMRLLSSDVNENLIWRLSFFVTTHDENFLKNFYLRNEREEKLTMAHIIKANFSSVETCCFELPAIAMNVDDDADIPKSHWINTFFCDREDDFRQKSAARNSKSARL